MTEPANLEPGDYASTLSDLKLRVRSAQLTARRRVNSELLALYWAIGSTILDRTSWGNAIVAKLGVTS